jgi:Skp family chaperone for outer membrane proteins
MLKINLGKFFRQISVIQLIFLITLLPAKVFATEAQLKIAVVDVQYVIEHSVAVVELRKSIDKISETLHKEMADKEVSLKSKEKELLEKKSQISQVEFDKLVNSFYKEVSIVQHDTQQKKTKLEQVHADAIAKIHENVLQIIATLAKEMKFNIALPISQILYTDKHLSVTDEVISRLNEALQSVPINYDK